MASTFDKGSFESAERARSRRPVAIAGALAVAGSAAAVVAWGMHTGAIQGLSPLQAGPLLAIGGVLIALALSVGLITMARRHKRKQVHAFESGRDALRSHGFEIDASPDKTLHRQFKSISRLTNGGKTTRTARTVIAGRDALVFEHAVTIHTGHASYTVTSAVWIVDAPQWPAIEIKPKGWAHRVLNKFNMARGLVLDDDEFNRAFHVKAADPAFAVTLLSPQVQRLMLEDRGTVWRTEPGRLCLMRQQPMKLDELPARAARIERFFALLPAELCV